jgi:hypothetical protein
MHQYLQRISPPSHREAPIQNNVPDLPDIIHIKTAIHSNVTFIEGLWNNKVWKSTHCSSGVASSTLPMGPTAAKARVNNPSVQCAWNVPQPHLRWTVSGGRSFSKDLRRRLFRWRRCRNQSRNRGAEYSVHTMFYTSFRVLLSDQALRVRV